MQSLFQKYAQGFSGCDGGDLGSPSSRSIWTCGIEWGGGEDFDTIGDFFRDESAVENACKPPLGYEDWNINLKYRYNWQLMKILSVIFGGGFKDYKKFAEKFKPFVREHSGFFKMNLYPLAFKNTSHLHWNQELSQITGFDTKNKYIDWIKENRFPIIRSWTEKYMPKLVLCTGINYKEEFFSAFCNDKGKTESETIDERELAFRVNRQNTIIAVIPFMSNHYGLVKNVSIQKFGERIRELMKQLHSIPDCCNFE